MIKTNNLNKYFNKGKSNEIHVINNTSIELPDTGLITILGDSGSGKTTLLNVLGGLDRYTGSLEIDGVKLNNYNMSKFDEYRAKNIGYIFQNYYLLPELSIYDNLKKQLEILDIIDPTEVKARIDYALKVVKLYKYKKKKPTELSGGQQQRASIARALVKETKILICDEPTGNLDSQNSLDVMNILKKISEKSLVLLVTHDKKLANFYSDKILNIVDGKIVSIEDNVKTKAYIDDNSNNVYLGDMESKEEGQSFNVKVYSNEEIPNINLELVQVNGTYYLKSNVKIKLQDETNLVFINDKHREKTVEEIQDDTTFDLSFHKDIYETNGFKKFFSALGQAFVNFFNAKGKTKFFRVIFIIIGLFLAGVNIFFTINRAQVRNIKENFFDYRSDLYVIDSSLLMEKYKDNRVNFDYREKSFTINYNSIEKQLMTFNFNILSGKPLEELYENKSELKYGVLPTNDKEIVIDYEIAKKLSSKTKYKISELVGKKFDEYTVTGILNTGSGYSYTVSTEYFTIDYHTYLFSEEDATNLEPQIVTFNYKTKSSSEAISTLNQMETTARVILIVTIVLFAVVVVYVLLTMRTKLIHEIKEIGILRSIGMKRRTLIRNNILEAFVLTLFTTLIGFVIGTIIGEWLLSKLNPILKLNVNLFTSYNTYLFVLIMFGLNIFFGILPMLTLLRKTPNEINTKYDI